MPASRSNTPSPYAPTTPAPEEAYSTAFPPRRSTGTAPRCSGVGASYPAARAASTSSGLKPRSANVSAIARSPHTCCKGLTPIYPLATLLPRRLASGRSLTQNARNSADRGDMERAQLVLGQISDFVWGLPVIILLVGTGIFLTIRLRGIQFRELKHSLWLALIKRKEE